MANGKTLFGQLMYGVRQLIVRYTQQSCDIATATAQLGNAYTEITPTNDVNSEVKVYTVPDLSGIFEQYTTNEDIELPNTLSSLSVDYVNGGGSTLYTENGAGASAGTSYNIGLGVSGTATASSSSIPKLLYTIDTPVTQKVPIINCVFFTPSIDDATILAILTAQLGATVLAWPIFKPKPLVITLFGQRSTASGRADYSGSVSGSTAGATLTISSGFGEGVDVTPIIEQQQFPPMLHGSFSLTASSSQVHTGVALISISGGPISGGAGGTATALASSSVTPTSISATSPAAIPTSGLYRYSLSVSESLTFGNYLVNAKVFDFASIA